MPAHAAGVPVASPEHMQNIKRDDLKSMMDADKDFALVEVLAPKAFNKFHLPEAINVPIGEKDFELEMQAKVPDKSKPVVVYCANVDCDASPTAARRLEDIGYTNVYDYAAGKEDWKDAGLPIEG